MFTRQHYNSIASVLSLVRDQRPEDPAHQRTISEIAHVFCETFAQDNPNFVETRFLVASDTDEV